MCKLRMILVPILAALLAFAILHLENVGPEMDPIGRDIRTVQFDAIIELRPSAPPYSSTVIFARYWVGADFYALAVTWAEPHCAERFFPIPPASLSMVSNSQAVMIDHSAYPRYASEHERPLGERGIFRFMYGDYSVENIMFAEQETQGTRVYRADLSDLEDGEHVVDIAVEASGCKRDVAELKVSMNRGRIDSMELMGKGGQLLKKIFYEYEGEEIRLCRQEVELPERPIKVGYRGKGMKVTVGGKEYQFRDLEATHHKGGRRCTVEYETVQLGEREVQLPARITVRDGRDGRLRRSARLMNIRQVDLDAAGVNKAAREYCEFDAGQRACHQIVSAQWENVSKRDVQPLDIETARELRDSFNETLTSTQGNIASRLKLLNMLMELDILLGDESELEQHYEDYLSTLEQNEMFGMVATGGYGVMEKAMLWNRRTLAARLLDTWLDIVVVGNDPKSLLGFAKNQLEMLRLWTTANLLERVSRKWHSFADIRFEAEALRCAALGKLCTLLHAPDRVKGLGPKVEIGWVSHVVIDDIEEMLRDSIRNAAAVFEELSEPTDAQKVLKTQLDKVRDAMRQTGRQ